MSVSKLLKVLCVLGTVSLITGCDPTNRAAGPQKPVLESAKLVYGKWQDTGFTCSMARSADLNKDQMAIYAKSSNLKNDLQKPLGSELELDKEKFKMVLRNNECAETLVGKVSILKGNMVLGEIQAVDSNCKRKSKQHVNLEFKYAVGMSGLLLSSKSGCGLFRKQI